MPETAAFSRIELWVQRVLRVPPDPQPPEGSPESIQVFRAGRNYYTLCLLAWFVPHFAALLGLILAHVAVSMTAQLPEWGRTVWRIAEAVALLILAISTILAFYAQRLNFALRWYMVTDRSLRIRSGVVNIQELTMTFSNIQEIRVRAGPLQNFLKLADVEVQSAGGGSKDGRGHIARFKSVSNANAIRDLLVTRLRQYRDSGLGESLPGRRSPDDAIEAARAVLAEARTLREQLETSTTQ